MSLPNLSPQDPSKQVFHNVQKALSDIGYPDNPIKTQQVRAISAQLFRVLPSKDIAVVLSACEELLATRDWAFSLIAYDWAFRVRQQYSLATFTIFERWLFEYVNDWYNCDDFCNHALGELLRQHQSLFASIMPWVNHENFAVRRAAAVIMIYPINKGDYADLHPLQICDLLLNDDHYLVQKGYGWLLKVFSKQEPQTVIDYLRKRHQQMPRTAFRYALEKLDKSTQKALMLL